MLNSEQIIDMIQSDCPSTYDVLIDAWDTKETADQDHPTPDQLLEILQEYDGDNYDVHYWAGRYAQMKYDTPMIEGNVSIPTHEDPLRIPLTEEDLNDLSS